MKFNQRLLPAAWGLLLLSLMGIFCLQLSRGLDIDSDLLALLPATERDPVIAAAMGRVERQWSGKTLFLVEGARWEDVRDAAQRLTGRLEASGLFESVEGAVDSQMEQAFFDLYFPHRFTLPVLKPEPGAAAALLNQAEQRLYSPMTSFYADLIERDPLFLFLSFTQKLPKPSGAFSPREGWLASESGGLFHILLTAGSREAIFSSGGQSRIEELILDMKTEGALGAGVGLLAIGLPRYAARAAAAAQSEVSLISSVSIAGVVLIFLLVFSSFRPLLLSLLPILTGLLCALVASFAIFGRVHLITLGFGASLIGVCVDYNFHFFCARYAHPRPGPAQTLRSIFSAISLGALTSAIGYLGLAIAPFPGLRQMAIFSVTGLAGAYFTVICLFGRSGGGFTLRPPRGLVAAHHLLKRMALPEVRRLARLAVPVVFLIIAVGLPFLRGDDDIRRLQRPPADLLTEEMRIRELVGPVDGGRFLLVEGRSEEAVLQREEALVEALESLRDSGQLVFFQGLSQFVPSARKQAEFYQWARQALIDSDALQIRFRDLGYDEPVIGSVIDGFSGTMPPPLTVPEWLEHPASRSLHHLWLGQTERGFAALVLLGGISDPAAIEALERKFEGVFYIDKVDDVSRLLRRYRHFAGGLAILSYLVIGLVLIAVYGFRRGLRTLLPAVTAALLTLALFALTGQAVNLFHLLALLMVLGFGIDYAIFFTESTQPETLLAVVLSYLTTCLAFGLLAFSGTPVLSAFGLTVAVGITLALGFAPVAGRWRSEGP